MANTSETGRRTPIQTAALATGAVFLLVGILGFIPGITSNYSELGAAGPTSEALLLGFFQVSILHNVVHLLFGVAGIAMARTATQARNFLVGGGIVYLILWLYGLLVPHDSAANFVPMNAADNWLHLVLGLGMIVLGVVLARGVTVRSRTART
jgi:type II secretory pathway component PulF